ncbi:MAG: maleate cis-trans isomerase [Burkholderiales bacterium]|nr:maleate cis-trans isomerase [Burkholderiales bacterium]
MALASKRIGLLVPSSNSTVEVEFYRALPADVSLHVARLPITQVDPESIAGMVDPLDAESRKLASADVDVIVLGAAAPSFLKGMGYDREMSQRIAQASGKPATTASTALLQSLAALGAKRIALGTAYSSKVNEIAIAFLRANGIEVVRTECLGLVDNLDIGRLDVQTAYELGRRIACPQAQAIAFLCTNWQSMAIIDRLEADTGLSVLSSTQFSVWAALKTIGYPGKIAGYGRLLRDMPALPQA